MVSGSNKRPTVCMCVGMCKENAYEILKKSSTMCSFFILNLFLEIAIFFQMAQKIINHNESGLFDFFFFLPATGILTVKYKISYFSSQYLLLNLYIYIFRITQGEGQKNKHTPRMNLNMCVC